MIKDSKDCRFAVTHANRQNVPKIPEHRLSLVETRDFNPD